MGLVENNSADVLVLGAGIVCLSLALKLQERGREALNRLLDEMMQA
jgi:glycine/D-amino acid oxidase-like deaminating enzyme